MHLRVWLLLASLSACSFDTDDLNATADEAVVLGDTEFECGAGTFVVHDKDINDLDGDGNTTEAEPEVVVATYHTTVVSGQPRFIEAWVWGKQINTSGDDDILEAAKIDCRGPVDDKIQTTQNALRGGPALKTTAHVVLTRAGDYECKLLTRTTHAGAELQVYGDQSCLAASPKRDASDFPMDNSIHGLIGEGQRVSKGSPVLVLPHTFIVSPMANHVSLHADIELTDINSNASGTTIEECEQPPYSRSLSALPSVRVVARQNCDYSNCFLGVCPFTQGPAVEITLSPRVHHQKLFATLNLPVSHAADCKPSFQVRARIEARGTSGTANDLCFHAARYSNTWAYTID